MKVEFCVELHTGGLTSVVYDSLVDISCRVVSVFETSVAGLEPVPEPGEFPCIAEKILSDVVDAGVVVMPPVISTVAVGTAIELDSLFLGLSDIMSPDDSSILLVVL